MAKIDFSTALFVALGNKRKADFELHLMQQEIANGNRAFTVSAILSLLENCDDAQDAVWHEVVQILHQPRPPDPCDPERLQRFAQTERAARYGMLLTRPIAPNTQKRVREFLTRTPGAALPQRDTA